MSHPSTSGSESGKVFQLRRNETAVLELARTRRQSAETLWGIVKTVYIRSGTSEPETRAVWTLAIDTYTPCGASNIPR